jgi:hypothetical protein
MKTVISVGIALALMLSVVPAMAGDTDTFQAFSKMAVWGEQELLTPLSDGQLATIEGAAFKKHDRHGTKCCGDVGVNIADIDQTNLNIGGFAYQSNLAVVSQSNR